MTVIDTPGLQLHPAPATGPCAVFEVLSILYQNQLQLDAKCAVCGVLRVLDH